MLFEKPGKCLFAMGMFLLFLFVPLYVQAWTQPSLGREVEEGFLEALKENPEYAGVAAEDASIRMQLEELRKKLASQDTELKKLMEEREKLQRMVFSEEEVKNKSEKIRLHGDQLRSIIQKLDSKFSKSKEYAALSLRESSLFVKKNLVVNRILFSSADKRILKYKEAMEKNLFACPSIKLAENLPKAKVEGSDEYKVAMYLVENHRKNPRLWSAQQGCLLLRGKVDRIARETPAIRELNRKISLKCMELALKNCLLQEKNPELAWKVKIAHKSIDFQKPETTGAYSRLHDELMKILRSDPEYTMLEKELQKLQEEHEKALDDFAAKSKVPEAVEYRKVKALLDEADKTASSGKAE
ncbi:MAG: hypothetical protein BWY31_02054 [Lentisphaerae bacterium ADurb.Bin242]|nr:MAG: hypothetical protein BWY31_02054 [Lentisphaerae bacterium ADurb.Bin242]